MSKIAYLICIALLFCASVQAQTSSESGTQVQLTLLNQDPNPAAAGATVVVRLKIANTGASPAKDIELEFLPSYPLSLADGDATQIIGTLDAFQTDNNYVQAQYTLKVAQDAQQGNFELKMRYRFGGGVWITQKFSISVISKVFAQIEGVDKSQMEPGKETNISFTIINRGNAPLQDLVFSWSEPTGVILPVHSDNTKYVKFLNPGEFAVLSYGAIADVNAKPGLYELQMTLSFEGITDSTTSATKSQAGIFVGGGTDFEVAFSESTQGQTSLSVANIGNNPAMSVSVSIPDQQGYRVAGTSSAIIGNLDKGDYTVVSFQIASTGNVSRTGSNAQSSRANTQTPRTGAQPSGASAQPTGGPRALRVVVQYTDTTGQRQSVEKQVPIQFRSSTGTTGTSTSAFGQSTRQSSSTNWYLLIGSLIVGLVGGFFYGKRRGKSAGAKK